MSSSSGSDIENNDYGYVEDKYDSDEAVRNYIHDDDDNNEDDDDNSLELLSE